MQAVKGLDTWLGTGTALFNTPRFFAFTWAKNVAVLWILERGYDVHFGDLDSVYFRDAFR
jgi:hypothetical protein